MNNEFAIGLHIVGFLTASGGKPLTSETIAETYGTNPVVIRRVLAKLQRAGLVNTQRGSGGGCTLAREAINMNLRDVFDAVNNNAPIMRRHPVKGGPVAEVLADYINALYEDAETALLSHLEEVSISEMDQEVRPRICKSFKK